MHRLVGHYPLVTGLQLFFKRAHLSCRKTLENYFKWSCLEVHLSKYILYVFGVFARGLQGAKDHSARCLDMAF